MNRLPDNFEKDFWDLMIPVTTDETTRSRRNLSVLSFVVSSIYLLEKSITDLRVFGLTLEGSNQNTLLVIAACLVAYWLSLFIASASRDAEINKERRFILNKVILGIKTRKDNLEHRYSDKDDSRPNKQTMQSVQSEYQIYLDQQYRTKVAKWLSAGIFLIVNTLPIILGVFTIYVLMGDLV